ncbi:MAG: hypothetical protein FJ000_01555 [Actinobacteria bacterium]|nr:hypothetical protein [Actinomycetota bacterium]
MPAVRLSKHSALVLTGALAAVILAGVSIIIWVANRDEAGATTRIETVLKENESRLMAMDGVVGVGVGEQHGQPVIHLYTDPNTAVTSDDSEPPYPGSLSGYDVVVMPTGPITAQPASSDSSPGGAAGDIPTGVEPPASPEPPAATLPPSEVPWTMDGTVTDVTADDEGRPIGLLVEDPSPQPGGFDKAWLRVDESTRFVNADGASVPTPAAESLQDGHVKVLITGDVADSYPVQTGAAKIMLL